MKDNCRLISGLGIMKGHTLPFVSALSISLWLWSNLYMRRSRNCLLYSFLSDKFSYERLISSVQTSFKRAIHFRRMVHHLKRGFVYYVVFSILVVYIFTLRPPSSFWVPRTQWRSSFLLQKYFNALYFAVARSLFPFLWFFFYVVI